MAGLFLLSSAGSSAYAQAVMTLPSHTITTTSATGFVPVMLKAIKVRPNEPLVFDFVIDTGTDTFSEQELKSETEKLAKYFLATVTIPEKELWVNLSPYEQDRIITDGLGATEMGRVMLAQDKVLKELSSSITHPESELGKVFWARLYAKTQEVLGKDIPVETFNKVWIVPQSAKVYEMDNTALLGVTSLKVMMDEDYKAIAANQNANADKGVDVARAASMEVFRSVILPAIEKEVNTGKDFAPLRQVYGAMVLATWYKNALKEGLLSQVYADQHKTAGVQTLDKNAKQKIYDEYVAAFKTGAFNFIHEDADPVTGEITPRQYFSGGEQFGGKLEAATIVEKVVPTAVPADGTEVKGKTVIATVALAKPTVEVQDEFLRTEGKEKDVVADLLEFKASLRDDPFYKGDDQKAIGDGKGKNSAENRTKTLNRFHSSDSRENVIREAGLLAEFIKVHGEAVPVNIEQFTAEDRTDTGILMIKPDGRKYQKEAITALQAQGFEVVEGAEIRLSGEEVDRFYEMHIGKAWYPNFREYMMGNDPLVQQENTKVLPLFLTRKNMEFAEAYKSPQANVTREGGISFDAAMLDMQVERIGDGVKVMVDPALIERMKIEGVVGFAPVIINMVYTTGVLSAISK